MRIVIRGFFLFFISLAIFYFFLLIFGKQIETYVTFPILYREPLHSIGEAPFSFEDINIKDSKGNNINGLYLKNDSEAAKTVYYFHGNGGPIAYFYSDIKYIHSLGYNVMVYDFPGYGKSDGFPYKESIESVSEIFYEYMKEEKGIKDEELIIWGYSIGTAIATNFASKHTFDRMILVAPLASRYDMSRQMLGFSLQKILFLKNSFDTRTLVQSMDNPIFIIHGNADTTVSFEQGKSVFENHKGEKYFIEIEGANHNSIFSDYGEAFRASLTDFLQGNNLDWEGNYLLFDDIR